MSSAEIPVSPYRTGAMTKFILKPTTPLSWLKALQRNARSERPAVRHRLVTVIVIALVMAGGGVWAQGEAPVPGVVEFFPMSHIVTFLVLMLGPFKIIGPFVSLTSGADNALERKIAILSVAFSGAALLLAGLLGEIILAKYGIPLPILSLSAEIILFVVAMLETTQSAERDAQRQEQAVEVPETPPTMRVALSPLAFPTIVPPYGIAALIVFLAFTPDTTGQLLIGGIVLGILLVNLLVMIFARRLIATMGIGLSVVGAVLGVVQVALGLQIIYNSLLALRVF